MKVLVIDFAATSGGAQSIVTDFYESIKNDNENEYYFLLSQAFIKETKNIKLILTNKMNWFQRLYFDYYSSKKIVKEIKPDCILSLQNTMPLIKNVKKVLYIHQSLPFQNYRKFSFFKKRERQLAMRQYLQGTFMKKSIKKSDVIIVQTKWMKQAVSKKCHIDEQKVKIIPPKIKLNNNKLTLTTEKYFTTFFYPTYDALYKNNELIYNACNILNSKNIKDFDVQLTMDVKEELSPNINFINRLTREECLLKYKTSVLIFPSYIESFGLPLYEARMCETIILAADTDFAREILDDYENAYFFNPFNEWELADLMKKCITKEIGRKTVTTKSKLYSDMNNIIDAIIERK